MNIVINKYLVGLLQVAIISVTAITASLAGGLEITEVFQLGALIIGAVVSVFVPLLEGGWAAGLKVGGAVLGAVIAAIIPLLTGVWSAESVMIVFLAGLNALATQIGVSVRLDQATAVIVNPEISNATIARVDAPATKIAYLRAA